MIDSVTIRHIEPADATALHQIYSQSSVVHNTLRLPYSPRSFYEKRAAPPQHVLHLVASYQGHVIGDIVLILATNLRRQGVASLGMAVSTNYRGQGVGTRLLQAAIDLGEGWLNLRRIELEVFCDNQVAVHLYKKFGFEVEGTLRQYAMRDGHLCDVYMMARLKKEYKMSEMQYEVRSGAYYDSVILMQLQKALVDLPDVEDAGAVMATAANRELLHSAGFDIGNVTARADDLLLVVRAGSAEKGRRALAQVDELLRRRRSSTSSNFRPKSLRTAAQMAPDAEWVLISTPGRYAAAVAEQALDLGKHVFLYSDNVALADELRLKEKASAAGLLLMGPDCGTAIVNGVGFGFANRVRRGRIGLVAASGTGLQAVSVAIHNRGAGISQALGTGGRDLSEQIGGISARQCLRLLADDPETSVIVLISKPPAPSVARLLLNAAAQIDKPVVVNFVGYAPPARRSGNLWFASGMSDAAYLACLLAKGDPRSAAGQRPTLEPVDGDLRALFAGGTLAYEATLALQAFLAPLSSNTPVGLAQRPADLMHSDGHTIIDLGDDHFTQGRLHPMIDNDLRIRRLREEAADSACGLLLLDVVLGEGAHADPATELAAAIAAIKQARDLPLALLIVGTDEDPQQIDEQKARLAEAGAILFEDVSDCFAAVARALAPQTPAAAKTRALSGSAAAINVGLESFYDSLIAQGSSALHVDWRPPAGGNERMMSILARLKGN